MINIFISYNRNDGVTARQLAELLSATFNRVWYDRYLRGGMNWWRVICREIERSDCVIFLLSRESCKSRHCQQELYHAQHAGKVIIPVLVRRFPEQDQVTDLHYIDMTGGITTESLNVLYSTLIRQVASFSDLAATQSSVIYDPHAASLPLGESDTQHDLDAGSITPPGELPTLFSYLDQWDEELWVLIDEIMADDRSPLAHLSEDELRVIYERHQAVITSLYDLREKYEELLASMNVVPHATRLE